jgi:hypothetical protein
VTAVLPFAAAAVLAVLGVIHLTYTLHEFLGRPKYFRPIDKSVLASMRTTTTAIAPDGRDYWSGVLGFHLSHSIGVLLFSLLVVVSTSHDIGWLKPVLSLTGVAYAAISMRCWFRIPTIGVMLATMMITLGWLVA